MVVELAIAVQIEIVDHKYEVLRRHFPVAIFSFKLANFFGTNISCAISVNTLKCCIGLKITNSSKNLAHFFDSKFLFGHEK